MFTEVVNCLQLSSLPKNKFIIVTKEIVSDINFVFCEILSYYFTKKYSVIMINFTQSCAHYNHVLLKSGLNMRQLRENEQFLTIDGISEIEKLTNIETNKNAAFNDLFCDSGNIDSMQNLFFLIKETIQKLEVKFKQYVLFIDDISSLFNLGLDAKCIFTFIQYCRSLCCSDPDTQNILLLGSVYDKNDLLNKTQIEYLLHLADIKIEVEGLKTGYSKDVHGKIILRIRNCIDGSLDVQKMLFKITEEGAKLSTLEV